VRQEPEAVVRGVLRGRAPQLVDHARRVTVDVLAAEVLAPESQAGGAHDVLVAGDHASLGVVEERVLVEVRGPDRQPAVVDNPELRVHVDRLGPPGLVERAGEEALVVVGRDEDAELPARVVVAVVGARRQDDHHAECIGRRLFELRAEDADDLR
jgi:hypothetical protein